MKVIKHLRDAYEKESRELDEIHTNEIESIKRSHERMNEALHEVEKRYAEAEKDLDEKTRKEILKTLKKNSDNPDHITQRISEITGFDIYVD
jgi:prefoldin subunit 5